MTDMANWEEYDKLLQEWESARKSYVPFCKDGIISDEENWGNTNKIMFLLKETYNHWVGIRNSGPQEPGWGTSPVFWRRMRMWTYIIDERLKGNSPTFEEVRAIKEEPNECIAYVNIKKFAEKTEHKGENGSNDYDILSYAQNDKDYLLRQIFLLGPKIIVCCATFRFLNSIYAPSQIVEIADRLYKIHNMYVIDFGHPSQRKSYKSNYEELKTIVSNIHV
jgi:hypothetical protein